MSRRTCNATCEEVDSAPLFYRFVMDSCMLHVGHRGDHRGSWAAWPEVLGTTWVKYGQRKGHR